MATTKAATVSIQKQAGYSALRLCAQTCVDRNNDNGDLEGHLECGDGLILNGCFCRADLRPKATAFLSSCIVTKCKYTNQDVTSALKLYDGYCSFKPTTSASTTKKSTTAKTTSTGSRTSSTTTAKPAPSITALSATDSASFTSSDLESLPTATPPESITSSENAAQPMSGGAIAGIVVGAVAAVVLLIGVLMWFCRRGQRRDEVGDPYFGQVTRAQNALPGPGPGPGSGHGGPHTPTFGYGAQQYHNPDAAYVAAGHGVGAGGMYQHSKSAMSSSDGSSSRRGVESFDMGTMAATRPTDFTTTNSMYSYYPPAASPQPAPAHASAPAPVEICDTGFRVELDAGRDGNRHPGIGPGGYRGEKG